MKNVLHNLIVLISAAVLPVAGVSCSSAQSPPVSYTSCLAYSFLATGAAPDGNVDVFVYDGEPPYRLDSSIHFDKLEDVMEIGSTSGAKKMVVLANCDRDVLNYDKVISYESLCSARQDLALEDPEKPLMSGLCEFTACGGASVEVNLVPALCRIRIVSVEVDFKGRPYSEHKMTIERAYLINVSGMCPIVPGEEVRMSDVVNYGHFDQTGTGGMKHPEMLICGPEVEGAVLYCYPYRGESGMLGSCVTKLVVETRMDGVTYYYPLEINDMQRGCEYAFKIRITRTGSLDPDITAEVDAVDVECNVKDWEEYEEEFEDY